MVNLASLIVAIISMVILSEQIFFKGKKSIDKSSEMSASYDSLLNVQQRINNKLTNLEKAISDIKTKDSIIKADDSKVQLAKLNDRILNIENIINQSPERLIRLQELNYQLQSLKMTIESDKELSETKISNLKERIDHLTIWTSGLIITIIGSIIGFAVNAFRKS